MDDREQEADNRESGQMTENASADDRKQKADNRERGE